MLLWETFLFDYIFISSAMLKEAFKSIYMVENVFHSLGFGSVIYVCN